MQFVIVPPAFHMEDSIHFPFVFAGMGYCFLLGNGLRFDIELGVATNFGKYPSFSGRLEVNKARIGQCAAVS